MPHVGEALGALWAEALGALWAEALGANLHAVGEALGAVGLIPKRMPTTCKKNKGCLQVRTSCAN